MKTKALLSPSTRAFVSAARRMQNFSLVNLLHGYIYGRWTYLYIALGTGRHPLAKKLAPLVSVLGGLLSSHAKTEDSHTSSMADTYHGKVVPLKAATQLVSVKEDIALGDMEKIIPYTHAREIILKNPDHIIALDCPCRSAKEHPCLPLDVCLVVGEPFASFVIEHHPQKSRWITQEEAQAILKAEDERGHVHHAFFKDAMLDRFYAICNCCSCCCGAMHAQQSGTPMLASSGFVAQVDPQLCRGCKKCQKTCAFDAVYVNGKAVINFELCMGCGICVGQCAQAAIQLIRLASKGEPLEIQALITAYHNQ